MYGNFILSKALIEGSEILWLLNSSPLINFKLSKRTSLDPTPKSIFKKCYQCINRLSVIRKNGARKLLTKGLNCCVARKMHISGAFKSKLFKCRIQLRCYIQRRIQDCCIIQDGVRIIILNIHNVRRQRLMYVQFTSRIYGVTMANF